MEWTCDLREMWVTRQRVERGRVTGACNRKICEWLQECYTLAARE